MKRVMACLLACMLLISGMLVYASAEKGDSIFTYDDSKAYVPNVILLTFRYNFYSENPYPANSWGSGAFGDVEPYIQNLKLVEEYDSEEDGTIFTYRIYQLSLVEMYQHDELINLAAHLAEEVMSVEAVNFPYCVPPRAVSLVEKPVVVDECYDDIIAGGNGALCLYVDHDYVTRDYPWSVEDFPELDVKSVRVERGTLITTYVDLKLNDSSKESLIDAAQKLAKRYEFLRVAYTTWDGVVPEDPADSTDDTTIPDDTTVPVTDVQTTAPAITNETTNVPEGNQPTSPKTGDTGKYAACICVVALLGVVSVVIYKRRRSV